MRADLCSPLSHYLKENPNDKPSQPIFQIFISRRLINAHCGGPFDTAFKSTKPFDYIAYHPIRSRSPGTHSHRICAIDLLVNNAGVLRAIGRVTDIDADDWWREVEINLRGSFLCSQAVLPGMITRKRGRIINVASGGGLSAFDCFSAYSTSKTALIRLSESLAIENKEYGIVVFAIHPGNVRTSMSEYLHDSEVVGQRAPWMQQTWRQRFAEATDTPIERSVTLVLQLAAGHADGLSGRYFDAEDNLTELLAHADEIQSKDLYTLRLQELSEI